jgi:nitrile hydratase accessory protein
MTSLDGLPGLVQDEEGPHFKAPWEAEAFAIAVALEKMGIFTWSEWARTIGDEIAKANAEGDPERLVREKNIASAETISRYQSGWRRAAQRTPHGKPIELTEDDLAVTQ